MSKQYLYRISILSKKDKHPLESIAYYCGESQCDIINSKDFKTTTNDKVVWSKIIIPDRIEQFEQFKNLPDYLKFRTPKPDLISNARNILWQNVNARETRADSQFARLFELAVPHFLTQEEAVGLMTRFSKILVAEGMIVDAALHNHNKTMSSMSLMERLKLMHVPKAEHDNGNEKNQDYTGFFMCTLRDYENGMFKNKNRAWNHIEKLTQWRSSLVLLLEQAINNAKEATPEEREAWINKLNIYPEYKQMSQRKPSI